MSRYAYQPILLAIFVSAAGAQQSISSTPGERVRIVRARADTAVRFSGGGEIGNQFEGRLVSMSRDSITVQLTHDALPLSLPLSAVDHVDVAAGKRRGKGALLGAVVGGVLLAGVGAATSSNDSFFGGPAVGALAGLVIGLPVGALTGLAIGSQRWVRADLPAHVTIAPLRAGGARIGLSMQF